MFGLTYREFMDSRDEFDAAVALTPEVSRFCSTSAWGLAAHDCLEIGEGEGEPIFVEEEGHWLAFAPRGTQYFQPLEAAWMFGCPLIGPDPPGSVSLLERVAREMIGSPRAYIVGGIEWDGDLQTLLRNLGKRALQYREFEGMGTMSIDLEKGVDGWLARRSRKFRKNLRAAEKKIGEAGISIEMAGCGESADALFERILSIQKNTKKWAEGTDIFLANDCVRFYRQLLGDLRETGRLRLQFARRDNRDVAHIFGGIFQDTYRGLQMSYVEEFAGLGVGNFLQWDNLNRMEGEGIRTYDLGMPSGYKYRWADHERKTVISVVVL